MLREGVLCLVVQASAQCYGLHKTYQGASDSRRIHYEKYSGHRVITDFFGEIAN